MKKVLRHTMRRRIWYPIIFVFLLAIFFDRLIGWTAATQAEAFLSHFFNMKVHFEGLRADLFKGEVRADRIVIHNPPGYSPRPHAEIRSFYAQVDVKKLLDHQIVIPLITLGKINYLIERQMFDGNSLANVKYMVRGIKEWKRIRRESARPEPAPGPQDKEWTLEIRQIDFQDGSFVYDASRVPDVRYQLSFHHLNGYLTDVRYPNDHEVLNQKVRLKGLFGTLHPTPFIIYGTANFIQSYVSFNLTGNIETGKVEEHKHFLGGIPVEIQDGFFELAVQATCIHEVLSSRSELVLRSLKLTAGTSVAEKIWGIPGLAMLRFLESSESVRLKIPVNGNITDPKFELGAAFTKAFQEAMVQHTRNGLTAIKEAPAKIAEQTQDLASKASEKIKDSVDAVKGIVANGVKPLVAEETDV